MRLGKSAAYAAGAVVLLLSATGTALAHETPAFLTPIPMGRAWATSWRSRRSLPA